MRINTDIGVISDTHGQVRPEALAALADCELILHVGDIGKPEVMDALSKHAEVVAIRGNVDQEDWAMAYPETRELTVNGVRIQMVHRHQDIKTLLPDRPCDVVLFGHSHKPFNETREGVLCFNPGSAGPRRFSLPVTVGRLRVTDSGVTGHIQELDVPRSRRRPSK
ncbi:MAG: metallophosphoesterase family protein [Oleiphilaceae bacterium]|nr:metallophosphoesterase family protein [Oleiphilaceae bacterium]